MVDKKTVGAGRGGAKTTRKAAPEPAARRDEKAHSTGKTSRGSKGHKSSAGDVPSKASKSRAGDLAAANGSHETASGITSPGTRTSPGTTRAKSRERKEVQALLDKGKAKGFLTYDEVNDALPPEMVTSEQIDNLMMLLADEDIEVVDAASQVRGEKKKAASNADADEDCPLLEEARALRPPRGGRGPRLGLRIRLRMSRALSLDQAVPARKYHKLTPGHLRADHIDLECLWRPLHPDKLVSPSRSEKIRGAPDRV